MSSPIPPWLSLLVAIHISGMPLRMANIQALQLLPRTQQGKLQKSERDFSLTCTMDVNDGEEDQPREEKRLILIRHGRSYMNEYIGANGINFGGPNFTDIFSKDDQESYYRDSPLSPTGQEQARSLHDEIQALLLLQEPSDDDKSSQDLKYCLQNLELVVVSPLTRAIQTAQLALLPHMGATSTILQSNNNLVPFVAQPLAAERLYLVSDIGTSRSTLKNNYASFVDFEAGFPDDLPEDQPWWWSLSPSDDNDDEQHQEGVKNEYVEWRPTGQGQKYLCPGEPFDDFEQRLVRLCEWLNNREENTIALVGHYGVFEWLLQNTTEDGKTNTVKFGNCEMRSVPFKPIWNKAKRARKYETAVKGTRR